LPDRPTVSNDNTPLATAKSRPKGAPALSARVPLGAALVLALINVLWAGSAIAAKIALGDMGADTAGKIGPYTLAFLRFGAAALLFYLSLRLRGQVIAIRRVDYRAFFLLGALGIAATYAVFYGGIRFTTAIEASLLIAAEPILIALVARLILGERLRRVQAVGLGIGFAGVYVIIVQGFVPTLSASALANAVVAFALCFESFASVLGKRLTGLYPGLVVITVGMGIGAAVLLPCAAVELMLHPSGAPGGAEIASLVFLAVVCSFLGYGVWFALLARHNISAMAGFLFIQPMVTPLYGYLFLGERLRFWTAAGAVLVLLGVWLVASVKREA